MSAVKRMSEIRDMAFETGKGIELVEGFTYVGRTSEGLLFEHPETLEYFVVKIVVKKESFDATEALESYEEKQELAKEKAKAKAKKVAKAGK